MCHLSQAASIISILTFAWGVYVGAVFVLRDSGIQRKKAPEDRRKIADSIDDSYRTIQLFARRVEAWGADYLPHETERTDEDQSLLAHAEGLADRTQHNLDGLHELLERKYELMEEPSWRKYLMGETRDARNRDVIRDMLFERDDVMREIQRVKQEIEVQVQEHDRIEYKRLMVASLGRIQALLRKNANQARVADEAISEVLLWSGGNEDYEGSMAGLEDGHAHVPQTRPQRPLYKPCFSLKNSTLEGRVREAALDGYEASNERV